MVTEGVVGNERERGPGTEPQGTQALKTEKGEQQEMGVATEGVAGEIGGKSKVWVTEEQGKGLHRAGS